MARFFISRLCCPQKTDCQLQILSEQRIILPICSLDSIILWASAAFEKGKVAYVSVVISELANIGQTVFSSARHIFDFSGIDRGRIREPVMVKCLL